MSEYNTILLEKEDDVSVLTINRPKALNALNSEVLQELEDALDHLSKDKSIRVLIVTGSGEKSFVAGADISEMANKNAVEGREFSELGNRVFSKLANLPYPTIAAVNGFALGGGCELALSTDIRIASKNAVFGQPEVGLGIIPGFGGTQRLTRLISTSLAKELIFTGSNIKADRALEIGLISHLVEEDLLEEAKTIASKIIKSAPIAVSAAKRAIDDGIELDLERGLALEAEVFGNLFSTEDQKEGMKAFLDKRKASFKNN